MVNNMTIANGFVLLLSGVVWLICILLGAGIGTVCGRPVGTLLGWMVANSLDASLVRGGRLGQQFGRLVGVAVGVGAGVYAALQITTYVTQTVHF
ncbi:MAG: hypothetical protein PVS3B3_02910 [Ktedonobacteraceae bacterium]